MFNLFTYIFKVKTLSFLTFLLRGYSDFLKTFEPSIVKSVLMLLRRCPEESVGTRRVSADNQQFSSEYFFSFLSQYYYFIFAFFVFLYIYFVTSLFLYYFENISYHVSLITPVLLFLYLFINSFMVNTTIFKFLIFSNLFVCF